METIKRSVCIEDIMGFTGGLLPSFKDGTLKGPDGQYKEGIDCDPEGYSKDDYTDWKRIPADILCTTEEVFNLPTYKYEKFMSFSGDIDADKKVIRYHTLLSSYKVVEKIILSTQYMKICVRGGKNALVSMTDNMWKDYFKDKEGDYMDKYDRFFSDSGRTILTNDTDISSIELGKIVCVLSFYEYLMETFVIGEGNLFSNLRSFMNFAKEKIYVRHDDNTDTTIPFITLPIYISERYKDNGILTPNIRIWEAGSRTYIGDRVLYNIKSKYGEVYRLIKGDKFEKLRLNGIINEEQLPYEVTETEPTDYTKTQYYRDSDGGLWQYTPYYTGYYSKSRRRIFFDEPDSSGEITELTHWRLCKSKKVNVDEKNIETNVGTHLSRVRRPIVSYDDDSNPLPFIIDTETMETDEIRYYVTLPYRKGVMHGKISDGKVVGDCIESVVISDRGGNVIAESEDNTPITVDSGLSEAYSIKIAYYLDSEINDDGNGVNDGTGIHYEEVYRASLKDYYCNLGDTWKDERSVIPSEWTMEWVAIPPDSIDFLNTKFKGDVKRMDDKDIPPMPEVGIICIALNNEDYDEYYDEEKKNTDYIKTLINNGVIETYEIRKLLNKVSYLDIMEDNPLQLPVAVYGYDAATDDYLYSVEAYKDDALTGVHDIKSRIDGGINRGKAAAFERHNILSEINTFEDLENYRNNYFNL